MYVYIYTYIYMYTSIYVYIYTTWFSSCSQLEQQTHDS